MKVYSNKSIQWKKERSQINYLSLYLKELGKDETKLRVSGRKEITRIKAEISETENRKSMKSKQTKSCLKKIDKPLGRLAKEREDSIHERKTTATRYYRNTEDHKRLP